MKHLIPKLLVLATIYSVELPGAGRVDLPEAGGDALTFVYLHGFGGVKESPEFCENLREFLAEEKVPSTVINYEWDSVEVDPLRAGASWLKAQKMADAEAPEFKRQVIDRLEREGRPYVLVGFSVGSRVIVGSLELVEKKLECLRGVYFLGSAMTKDTTLTNRQALPEGMKITNYHSPIRDLVHRTVFNFISESRGGGQVGFDDTTVFENYPVACAHAHKGLGIATDYSGLAEAIAFLELDEHGVMISGSTKPNWEMPVMEGDFWWNRIKSVRAKDAGGEPITVELEQHTVRSGYYRALRLEKNGKRRRVARGDNLHAILSDLGLGNGAGRSR